MVAFAAVLVLSCCQPIDGSDSAGASFLVQGVQPRQICFQIESLPDNFEVFNHSILPNEFAARNADDPQDRLDQFIAQGRMTGASLQWTFESTNTPDEDADGFMSESEISEALHQAHEDSLGAQFTGASCSVDFYETSAGAGEAYRTIMTGSGDTENSASAPTELKSSVPYGDEGMIRFVREQRFNPEEREYIVTFRVLNVIGAATVTASCDIEGEPRTCAALERDARALGFLLFHRIVDHLKVNLDSASTAPDLLATTTASDRTEAALLDCPDRDYTGCIATYADYSQRDEKTALCRTPLGQWFFESPNGGVDDLCSDDESIIIAIIGR